MSEVTIIVIRDFGTIGKNHSRLFTSVVFFLLLATVILF